MRIAAGVALAVLATPAAADPLYLGAGYMMSRPIAGDAGGADHALVVHGERVVRPDVDVGLTLQGGFTPGNDEETLKRFAVLPTLGLRGDFGAVLVRADLAVGWQLANGRTRLGTVPVAGTEARGLRAEFGVAAQTLVSDRVAVRARLGLSMDAVFPVDVQASKRLGPLVELGIAFAL